LSDAFSNFFSVLHRYLGLVVNWGSSYVGTIFNMVLMTHNFQYGLHRQRKATIHHDKQLYSNNKNWFMKFFYVSDSWESDWIKGVPRLGGILKKDPLLFRARFIYVYKTWGFKLFPMCNDSIPQSSLGFSLKWTTVA